MAWRALRLEPRRTALVVLALVLGLWGAGAPLVSWIILEADLDENFQRTRPPHLVLVSEQFERLELARLLARPEVEAASFRDFALHRVEVRPDTWLPLWLYGVDFDDDSVLRRVPQRGERVPPPGTVLVERDGLRVSDFALEPGRNAPRIRVGARTAVMPISGITFDASQAPATQDAFIYAYADRPTWAALTGAVSGRRLIVRLAGVGSVGEVRRAAARLTEALAADGIAASAEVLPFEAHPHQWQLDTLLFLVSAIGALALALAAVLVSQTMRAMLAGQVRQIGVLKALGATRGQVLRIAVMSATAMGGMAGLVGVPLAAVSGWRFSEFVARQLNFDLLTPGVPIAAVLGLALASVLLPSLFSLPTLLRGTRISARAALADFGVTAGAIGRRRVRSRLPPRLALAVRNVLRDRARLVVTLSSMALGVAIFATGFNVRASLWHLLARSADEHGYDVQVVLEGPRPRAEALAPFAAVRNVARVEAWSGGQGELQSRLASTREGVGVVALPRGSDLLRLRLVAGRWLAPSTDAVEVVLNQQGWLAYGKPALGSRLELKVGSATAAVVLVGLAAQFEKAKLYLDQADFDARFNPRHGVTTLLFVAERGSYGEVRALKRELERAVAGSELSVLYVMSHAERVRIIAEHLDIVLVSLLLLSFLVLLVSAIGHASAVGIDVLARTRELGVMRAIGATPKSIARLLRLESALLDAAAVALGVLLSVPLSLYATRLFGALLLGDGARLEPAVSVVGLLVTLVLCFGFGLLASWVPARRALRVPTHEALAHRG